MKIAKTFHLFLILYLSASFTFSQSLKDLNLKVDENKRVLIPFSAVKSIGDFVIVSENELL